MSAGAQIHAGLRENSQRIGAARDTQAIRRPSVLRTSVRGSAGRAAADKEQRAKSPARYGRRAPREHPGHRQRPGGGGRPPDRRARTDTWRCRERAASEVTLAEFVPTGGQGGPGSRSARGARAAGNRTGLGPRAQQGGAAMREGPCPCVDPAGSGSPAACPAGRLSHRPGRSVTGGATVAHPGGEAARPKVRSFQTRMQMFLSTYS